MRIVEDYYILVRQREHTRVVNLGENGKDTVLQSSRVVNAMVYIRTCSNEVSWEGEVFTG